MSLSLSVVMPCYNVGRYIEKTLVNILNQDYPIMKVIAIDDGSTDDTLEILRKYSDRINILFHKNNINVGQSKTINVGIEYVNTDLIAFADADDIWYPGKVQKQVEVFKQHNDVGFVYV